MSHRSGEEGSQPVSAESMTGCTNKFLLEALDGSFVALSFHLKIIS